MDQFAADDEWDDLPLVRGNETAPSSRHDNNNNPPHRSARAEHPHQQQQHPSPRLQPPPLQHPPPNHLQQRKRSRSSDDPPPAESAAQMPTNPSQLSRAVTAPPPQAYPAADATSRTAEPAAPSAAAAAAAAAAANQQPKKEKDPVPCRGFSAGFCSAGVECTNIHDGLQAEQRRTAWLAGGALPGPPPEKWGLVRDTARRRQGPFGGLPGVAAGVPPVLVIAGTARNFVCARFFIVLASCPDPLLKAGGGGGGM